MKTESEEYKQVYIHRRENFYVRNFDKLIASLFEISLVTVDMKLTDRYSFFAKSVEEEQDYAN